MTYTIQSGDTLSAIARRHNTTVEALARANNIANPDRIRAGDSLVIPGEAPSTPDRVMEPTTGIAPPRPRPARPADSVPLPRPNPQQLDPIPRPRPEPLSSGPMRSGTLQRPQPAPMMQQGPGMVPGAPSLPNPAIPVGAEANRSWSADPRNVSTNPDAYAGLQGSRFTANPPERAPFVPGANGMPNFAAMTIPELQQAAGNIAALPPEALAALGDAIDQKQAEATQAYETNRRSPQMQEVEAFRRSMGVEMRPNPAQPVERSIGEGEYLPQEQQLIMALRGNQSQNPQANTMSPPNGWPTMAAPPPPPTGPVGQEQWGNVPPPIPGQMPQPPNGGLGAPRSMPGQFGLQEQPGAMPTMGQGEAGNPVLELLMQLLMNGGAQQTGGGTLVPALIRQLQGAR